MIKNGMIRDVSGVWWNINHVKNIYIYEVDGEFYVEAKLDTDYICIKDGFKTVKKAQEYLDNMMMDKL